MEPLHDVTKNELAARVPPCVGRGDAAWYRLSMLTPLQRLSAMKSLAAHHVRPRANIAVLLLTSPGAWSRGGKLILRIAMKSSRSCGEGGRTGWPLAAFVT